MLRKLVAPTREKNLAQRWFLNSISAARLLQQVLQIFNKITDEVANESHRDNAEQAEQSAISDIIPHVYVSRQM
jgi:hypothetical protein